jgi:hypothetical protein
MSVEYDWELISVRLRHFRAARQQGDASSMIFLFRAGAAFSSPLFTALLFCIEKGLNSHFDPFFYGSQAFCEIWETSQTQNCFRGHMSGQKI